MAQPQGTLFVRQDGGTVTYRAEGRACMAQGLAMRRAAEKGLAGGLTAVRVDLRGCTYMDSTFIGTLLFLKRAADRNGPRQFALVAPSAPCHELLRQMGLEDVFDLVTAGEPAAPGWVPLGGDLSDVASCKTGVVEAHEELAALPGPAGEQFRAVMRCLAKEGES